MLALYRGSTVFCPVSTTHLSNAGTMLVQRPMAEYTLFASLKMRGVLCLHMHLIIIHIFVPEYTHTRITRARPTPAICLPLVPVSGLPRNAKRNGTCLVFRPLL